VEDIGAQKKLKHERNSFWMIASLGS